MSCFSTHRLVCSDGQCRSPQVPATAQGPGRAWDSGCSSASCPAEQPALVSHGSDSSRHQPTPKEPRVPQGTGIQSPALAHVGRVGTYPLHKALFTRQEDARHCPPGPVGPALQTQWSACTSSCPIVPTLPGCQEGGEQRGAKGHQAGSVSLARPQQEPQCPEQL